MSEPELASRLHVTLAPDPHRVIVARNGSPLLLGIVESDTGDEGSLAGCYAASDASALLQVTRRIIYLENGDLAELSADHYGIFDADGEPVATRASATIIDARSLAPRADQPAKPRGWRMGRVLSRRGRGRGRRTGGRHRGPRHATRVVGTVRHLGRAFDPLQWMRRR